MVIATVSKVFTSVFGSRNDRLVKSYFKRVEQINALEPEVRKLTDAEIRMLGCKRFDDLCSGVGPIADEDEITGKTREISKERLYPSLFVICRDHQGAVSLVHTVGTCIV